VGYCGEEQEQRRSLVGAESPRQHARDLQIVEFSRTTYYYKYKVTGAVARPPHSSRPAPEDRRSAQGMGRAATACGPLSDKGMRQIDAPGQIIILNGAPRSGKSSIATVVQYIFAGVWMNLGSAVLMPEVLLKAVSVVRNFGHSLDGLVTVNVDKESRYRSTVNVLSRPSSEGIELTGHHEVLLPLLHAAVASRAAVAAPAAKAA